MENVRFIAKHSSIKYKCHPIFISLSFVVLLILSMSPAEALVQTRYQAASTATVTDSSIQFGGGTKGASIISLPGTSADVIASAGVVFSENANALVTASLTTPSIDTSVISSGLTGTSDTVTLATTSVYEMIYVVVSILGTTSTVSSITNSGTALNWAPRANIVGTAGRIQTYYAVTSTPAFSGTITVSVSALTSFEVTAIAIKDASITAPFDPNLPTVVSSIGSATNPSVTISTLNPNDLIIGAIEVSWPSNAPSSISSGSGFTPINSLIPAKIKLGLATEYRIVTTQQNSVSVGFTIATNKALSWAMIADAIQGKLPTATTNTALSAPISSGSFTVPAGSSALLWSPVFASAQTLSASSWVLNIWSQTASSTNTMKFMLCALDTSGANTALIASGNTNTITTTKQNIQTTFSGVQTSVMQNGRILLLLTNTGATTITIYWGTSQTTSFSNAQDYDYILTVANTEAATAYSISLLSQSSSSISRLSSLTVSIHTLPSGGTTTQEITITNGAFTLTSGPTITLPASTTYYISLSANANEVGTSTLTLVLKFSPNTGPFTYSTINLTVN